MAQDGVAERGAYARPSRRMARPQGPRSSRAARYASRLRRASGRSLASSVAGIGVRYAARHACHARPRAAPRPGRVTSSSSAAPRTSSASARSWRASCRWPVGADARVVVISTASSLGDEATELYLSLFRQMGIADVRGMRPLVRDDANDQRLAAMVDDATADLHDRRQPAAALERDRRDRARQARSSSGTGTARSSPGRAPGPPPSPATWSRSAPAARPRSNA